jgi:putative sterol carrier protein
VFTVRHDTGPGDDRIRFSKEISKASLGQGSTLSIRKIPPHLLEQMNVLLSELGYPEVGPDWDHTPSPYLPAQTPADQGETIATVQEMFDRHFLEKLKSQSERATAISGLCKVSINGEGGGSWIINLAEQSIRKDGDEVEPDCVVAISTSDFVDMVHGRLNPASAFDRGKIRVAGDRNLVTKVGRLLFGM